jgi:hypothetical protein
MGVGVPISIAATTRGNKGLLHAELDGINDRQLRLLFGDQLH